jgi:hypothetical protein
MNSLLRRSRIRITPEASLNQISVIILTSELVWLSDASNIIRVRFLVDDLLHRSSPQFVID